MLDSKNQTDQLPVWKLGRPSHPVQQ